VGTAVLLLQGFAFPSLAVHAADDFQIVPTTSGSTATVAGSISLTAGTSSTLETVPDFEFGTQSTSAENKNYAAKSNRVNDDSETVNAPTSDDDESDGTSTITAVPDSSMQLTVRNPGRVTGWSIYVHASDFIQTGTNDIRVLQGAILSIKKNMSNRQTGATDTNNSDQSTNGDARIWTGDTHQTTDEAPQSPLIDNSEATSSTDTSTTADVTTGLMSDASNFVIPMSTDVGAAEIFAADAGKGVGVWNLDFSANNVRLDVPAGNVAGSYQADLTWELYNAPQNSTEISE
jgi:hypothetical protein